MVLTQSAHTGYVDFSGIFDHGIWHLNYIHANSRCHQPIYIGHLDLRPVCTVWEIVGQNNGFQTILYVALTWIYCNCHGFSFFLLRYWKTAWRELWEGWSCAGLHPCQIVWVSSVIELLEESQNHWSKGAIQQEVCPGIVLWHPISKAPCLMPHFTKSQTQVILGLALVKYGFGYLTIIIFWSGGE